MQKSLDIFSNVLLYVFDLVVKSSCICFWGEPQLPEELKKEEI